MTGVPTAPPILSVNENMIELFARPELRLQPMRLLSAPGPFFSGICWVPIFRENPRIGTARPRGANCATRVFKKAQTFFDLGPFLGDLASQCRSHLSVLMPEFICGHGFESFHDPPLLFLPLAQSCELIRETGLSRGSFLFCPDPSCRSSHRATHSKTRADSYQ